MPGATLLTYVQGPVRTNRWGHLDGDTVTCPEGQYPIGGGVDSEFFTQRVVESRPARRPPSGRIDSWYVAVYSQHGTTDYPFRVYVVCMPATTVTANF